MFRKSFLLGLLKEPLFSGTIYASGNQLIVASSSWPPIKIVDGNKHTGVANDLFVEIARRVSLEPVFFEGPWIRCLELLKSGTADITVAHPAPGREDFLYIIDPPLMKTGAVAFYIRADSGVAIDKYEDVYKYQIGEVRGGSHWEEYNNDKKIARTEIATPRQLILMLMADRIDAFVGMEFTSDWEIKQAGFEKQIIKAKFGYHSEKNIYFMLSKKSVHAGRLSEFSAIIQQLRSEGYIDRTINSYRE